MKLPNKPKHPLLTWDVKASSIVRALPLLFKGLIKLWNVDFGFPNAGIMKKKY